MVAGQVLAQFCKALRPSIAAPAIDTYSDALAKIRQPELRKLLLEACNDA